MGQVRRAEASHTSPAVRREQAPCGPEFSLAFRLSRGGPSQASCSPRLVGQRRGFGPPSGRERQSHVGRGLS